MEVRMETDKKYFQVGLFVIVMILVGIGFTIWLTSTTRGNYDKYFIRFSESVSGLNKESTVKFRGVDVGNVEKISIDHHNPKLVQVDISVLESTPIKTDTTATLKLYGITGEVYIELSGGGIDSPRLDTKKNKSHEIKAKPSDISAIVNGLPKLLEKANHTVDQLNKIFSDENVQLINNVAKKLGKL
jgi:phospholipid/cholesterol/gamma-HCH transport system substrate-binding protein